MEANPSRGFQRILVKLEASTRNRFCADALQDELLAVHTQLLQCTQAIAHATQVDAATTQLLASSSSGDVRVTSPDVHRFLTELSNLRHTFKSALHKLVPESQVQRVNESGDSEASKLLRRLSVILAKQRRGSWLNDALGIARDIAQALSAESKDGENGITSEAITQPLRLLCKALMENRTTHADQIPVFCKTLRKIAKRRPDVAKFVERSAKLMANKVKDEEPAALQALKTTETSSDASTKSKKRKLSTVESEGASSKKHNAKRTVSLEARPAVTESSSATSAELQRPIKELQANVFATAEAVRVLGDTFSLSAFDKALEQLVEVVNNLSQQLTGADTTRISTSLFAMVEKVEKIRDSAKRLSRLVYLEDLLCLLIGFSGLAWSDTRMKSMANEYWVNCKHSMELLRATTAEHTIKKEQQNDGPRGITKPPKAKKMHVRFDE
ncbi:hypothetical protein Poli38472_011028 [Pythium oligandrum]|uniref:Uncharacterized protein n=1 Tax=Pythium oligandrum TaxID=41045 RepID=A0A8K1FRA8_PYTOL|nr:hypothetical protein Poli38472_011028 [Pythium oligandrum]|eukprot:TMW67408.1 hypothetical protein Poli38472_011028 [Pythium oligandrum]